MREIELKLLLTPPQVARLRRDPVLKELGQGTAQTQTLVGLYYDTAGRDLREAGIALRLRRVSGVWIQTVKKASGPIAGGLASPLERECVVPRRALALGQILDDDLREEVIGLARAGLEEVAQTRFRRTSRQLRSPHGGLVELCIDTGEVLAGGRRAAFAEAELELLDGHVGDLYALAERLFREGPVRYSDISKSGRAALLAETGEAVPPPRRRKAVPVVLPAKASVEQAARQILTEGLAHAQPNLPLVLSSDSVHGPHQLRVGLRRLRSALSAFRPVLGRAAIAPLGTTAQVMAAEAGRLRDLDVLLHDLIAPLAQRWPGDAGFARLTDAVRARRERVRAEVCAALAGPEATAFAFRMAGFLAMRGWLDPTDHDQTRKLAQPIAPYARKVLSKRWKVVRAYGARIEDLTIDERHEMRKEIKKMRYLVDAFHSLYDADLVDGFIRPVKRLQKAFGALNDSAMAEMILMPPPGSLDRFRDAGASDAARAAGAPGAAGDARAPGAQDPLAQRAAGQVLGHLAARSDNLWPEAVAGWQALSARKAFWR